MEYFGILIILSITGLLLYYFNNNTAIKNKTKIIKKHELEEQYLLELKKILIQHNNNKELQLKEKINFIKKVNYELSMNLFFSEKEAKIFLRKLSNYKI